MLFLYIGSMIAALSFLFRSFLDISSGITAEFSIQNSLLYDCFQSKKSV